MKKLILTAVILLIFTHNFFAQKPNSQTLNQQIATFYQQGKLDDAIPLAEKVVENEKNAAKDSETHALALMNLAFLHKERMRVLGRQNEIAKPEEHRKFAEAINKDASDAENLLRESLEIYEKLSPAENLSGASIKSELAWILNNHLAARSTTEVRARIDEAEKLYTESLALQEKLAGKESDAALKTVLALGDFYTRWINFEKALPYYDRYVETIESRYGKTSKSLVSALRGISEILVVTVRSKEAENLSKRISEITGKSENLPTPNANLAIRAKKIEKVNSRNFIPPDFREDAGKMFSYASGAGAVSPMGRARIKYVLVDILVDENGNVIEAKASNNDSGKTTEIEEAARNSKFRPFTYDNTARKMRGNITYAYFEN